MTREEFERKWRLRMTLSELLEELDAELLGEPWAGDPMQVEMELGEEGLPF